MTTSSLIWLSLFVGQADGDRGTLESVDSVRGGRHWIDQKTAPPKSPEESRQCFEIEPGVKIELVAAEPVVRDPVAIAFDHRGQMFVVEYGDYPTGPGNPDDPPLSRVVLIENALDTGQMTKRHVFADNLKFAHSLMPLMGGILVGAQTQIVFLKDTTGDHRADVREVWFDGFVPAHPQMQIGNPRWGPDNRVYLNYGVGRIQMTRPGFKPSEPVTLPRKEFWFDPLTMEFGSAGGLGQFGNTIDNRGYRFFTTNRNPIMVNMLPPEAVKRNPFAIFSKTHTDVGPSGGDTRVYPLVDMKSNYLSHAGTHTSACGVTAYRGHLFDDSFHDSVFVCEPIGHLVTRTIVRPDREGVLLTAQRAREKADFLASSDTWFRPASLATGPDGALYVADMYRLWVEHPKFLPDDIAARIDWRAGEDRGRIWRIVPEGRRPAALPERLLGALNESLRHPNGWQRRTARRLLVEKRDVRSAEWITDTLLEPDYFKEDDWAGRVESLQTLDGLGRLTWEVVAHSLKSPLPEVQRVAVRLAGQFLKSDSEAVLTAFLRLAEGNTMPQVLFQMAITLGETDHPGATRLLVILARRHPSDTWLSQAIVAACRDRSGAVAAQLRYISALFLFRRDLPGRIELVRRLAEVSGARGDVQELALLLEPLNDSAAMSWWRMAVVSGLTKGLPRHRGDLAPLSLAKLISNPPETLASHAPAVRSVLDQCVHLARNSEHSVPSRRAAIQLLGNLPAAESRETFAELLGTGQPAEVQAAAISTMQQARIGYAPDLVLEKWSQLSPDVQSTGLGLLLSRTDSTRRTLQAMADGSIPAAVIDVDRRVRLLRHSDEAIRKVSSDLFGGAVSANRREVAQTYRKALEAVGTPAATAIAGAAVFKRTCSKCHKIDGRGTEVGPDISDVRNRSLEALLFDILDPNRKVEPRFMDYTVVTTDGRTFNGLMLSETAEAVVLRQAEGKQQVVPRAEIEILKASGRSLMPEGVEKDVTVQQMADLLTFLKSRKRPAIPK